MMELTSPIGQTPLDDRPDGLVGRPLDRVDGPAKVTGRATYAYEYREPEGIVYGFVVPSTIAKGRIGTIDSRAAEALPGVIGVMTHRNAPRQGPAKGQIKPLLVDDRIDHWGQPVALVVAQTFETARDAAKQVVVDYVADDTGAFDLRAAMSRAEKPKDARIPPDTTEGDFQGAFDRAAVKLDVTYSTPVQSHAMMEPHATLAVWDGDRLTLFTANQMLNRGQDALSTIFRLPKEKVRLVARFVGGGFGAKLAPQPDAILAGLAARMYDRPVKIALTRQQVFPMTTRRSDTIQRVRIGADRSGKFVAIGHESWSDNLPGDQTFETAAQATRSLYAGDNRLTRHRLAALDLPVASAMRAPGEAVGLLALECAVDEVADTLKIDPVALRILNEPAEDPEKHVPFSTRALVPCLREGARLFGWDKRDPVPGRRREGSVLIGMGVASAIRGNPMQPSKASVRLGPDGIAVVRMAMTDIGTGTYTILTQIAAEMLGLPMDKIRMELGDTDFPSASGSGGSFGAGSAGSALYDACEALRGKLLQATGWPAEGAVFADGRVTAGNRSARLATLAGPSGIEAEGAVEPGDLRQKYSQFSFGAHFAEVGVDVDSGEIRLRRMLGVFTAGRILNAKTAHSQAIGGMTFGVGAALMEAVEIDRRYGSFVNADLAEYHVPVNADIPALEAVFLPELDDKSNALKSKGLGELGICGAGAAVANAVYNATGVRIRDYPLTLDKVLAGFEAREMPQRRSAVPEPARAG